MELLKIGRIATTWITIICFAMPCLAETLCTKAAETKKGISESPQSYKYALMGKEFCIAFYCSSLAAYLDNESEQDRLFEFGYERGHEFLNALFEKKIKSEDISSEVPMIVVMSTSGPTKDFILGKIFARIEEIVIKESVGRPPSRKNGQLALRNKFDDANCQFIGK